MSAAKHSPALTVRMTPPLPDAAPAQPPSAGKLPPQGCYIITYTPISVDMTGYQGTMRLDVATGELVGSGDLYLREMVLPSALEDPVQFAPLPDPAAGIPVFPIGEYRYYLRVTGIHAAGEGFSLALDAYRYNGAEVRLLDGSLTAWPHEDSLMAELKPAVPPPGFPRPEAHFAGDVANAEGTVLGRMSMGWVSPHLRKGILQIDHVRDSEVPLDNGAGADWKSIFGEAGWDIALAVSPDYVADSADGIWNKGEAHAAMEALRGKADLLDREWRYHMLAVQKIDYPGGERGVMYDENDGGPNHIVHEGLMVASHWPIPPEKMWGLVQGRRAGETVTYFRTALHELGHAMSLDHQGMGVSIMRPSDGIAMQGTAANPFPTNIQWSFAPDDLHRLRHWPDLAVRPGGTNQSWSSRAPINRLESNQLLFDIAPVRSSVPLGAPVRVELRLANPTDHKVAGPAGLSLSSGRVRGEVLGPAGLAEFVPLAVGEGTLPTQEYPPHDAATGSLTLLYGRPGTLFPVPGVYRVLVEVSWPEGGVDLFRLGETRVTVTAAADAAHAAAAEAVLAAPGVLLTLVFGGDHVEEGIAAIGAALANETLRPHFAYIEAKRLATRFGERSPDLSAAAALIDDTTVMSVAEVTKAAQIVVDNADSAGASALAAKLKAWAGANPVSDEVRDLIESLTV